MLPKQYKDTLKMIEKEWEAYPFIVYSEGRAIEKLAYTIVEFEHTHEEKSIFMQYCSAYEDELHALINKGYLRLVDTSDEGDMHYNEYRFIVSDKGHKALHPFRAFFSEMSLQKIIGGFAKWKP